MPRGRRGIVQTVRSWFGGKHEKRRGSGVQWRGFDGAAMGQRTAGWRTPSSSANAEIETGLIPLRDRSRDIVRNTPYGKRLITALTTNLVDTGLTPTLDLGSDKREKRVMDIFEPWNEVCHPSGPMTFFGIQALLGRSWFEAGEVLVRRMMYKNHDELGRGIPPLHLQPLEADHLPIDKTEALADGSSIEQGVEFDGNARLKAYHLYKVHPGAPWTPGRGFLGRSETHRYLADDVRHVYEMWRPGQVRGLPCMHPIVMLSWDLAGYADTEGVRAKSAATFVAVVTGGDDDWMSDAGSDALTSSKDVDGTVLLDSWGRRVERLSPGLVCKAGPGTHVDFTKPGTAEGYKDFISAGVHQLAAGGGTSYEELSGDLSLVNFSSARMGANINHKLIRGFRELVFIPFALNPMWRWFIDACILYGLLDDSADYYRVKWRQPAQSSVDRLTDAKADELQLRLGTHSRPEIIAASGRDPETVDREIERDQRKRDKLGIVLDSDPRQTTRNGQIQTATWKAPASTTTGEI